VFGGGVCGGSGAGHELLGLETTRPDAVRDSRNYKRGCVCCTALWGSRRNRWLAVRRGRGGIGTGGFHCRLSVVAFESSFKAGLAPRDLGTYTQLSTSTVYMEGICKSPIVQHATTTSAIVRVEHPNITSQALLVAPLWVTAGSTLRFQPLRCCT
jgi:hypothetical protein